MIVVYEISYPVNETYSAPKFHVRNMEVAAKLSAEKLGWYGGMGTIRPLVVAETYEEAKGLDEGAEKQKLIASALLKLTADEISALGLKELKESM